MLLNCRFPHYLSIYIFTNNKKVTQFLIQFRKYSAGHILICHRKQIFCFSFCLHLKYSKNKNTTFLHFSLLSTSQTHIKYHMQHKNIHHSIEGICIFLSFFVDFFLRKKFLMAIQNNLERWDMFYIKYSENQEKCLKNYKLCLHKALKHLGDEQCFLI